MQKINILEARNKLSQLIKSAAGGEEVIIANRGLPVARLVGISGEIGDAGEGPRILRWLTANPLPDHARRSAAEISTTIDSERSAWD